MKDLHDRINQVIHTSAFLRSLEERSIDLFDFQASWAKLSKGNFDNLPADYRDAILAGEAELKTSGQLVLAA